MRSSKIIISAFAVSCLLVAPATAGGLLGGVLGGSGSGSSSSSTGGSSSGGSTGSSSSGSGLLGGGGLLGTGIGGSSGSSSGGTNVGGLVTLQSGTASNSGLVNLGLGGSNGNVLDANVGGDSLLNDGTDPLVHANVSSGGDSGLLDVGAQVGGDLATANVGVGGDNLVDVGVGIGGGVGGIGGPGAPGAPGAPGGIGAGGGTYAGGAYFGGAGNAACMLDTRNVVRLLQARYSPAQVNQWGRAAGVQLVKIPVCPQIRQSVARAAASNTSISMMQGMAATDPLISTSLGRAHSNASHVLGVGQAGGNLVVYVY
ncbi:MAG: hypothetical protein ABI377_06005 [Devosia sp.]